VAYLYILRCGDGSLYTGIALDLERRLGLTGGDLYHGAMTLDQLFMLRSGSGPSSHHTPVAGLFLAGSGAHPGGGVFGVPGRNAARTVLGTLGGEVQAG